MAPVVIDGLSVSYRTRNGLGWRRSDPRPALHDVSLSVPAGRCLGVIGGNGSGKTTLLQAVAGVLRPSAGTITVTGRVSSLVDLSAGFHRDLTGHENVMIGGVLLGLTRREIRDRYDEIVAFSGLDPQALDARLGSYSAGMGLRLGFSLVAHSDPDVLLVDEVLAVGDDAFQRQCVEQVAALRARGCTVVLVSHDMDLVRAECDQVALLHRGELVTVGDPDDAVAGYLERGGASAPAPPAGMFGARGRSAAARRKRGT